MPCSRFLLTDKCKRITGVVYTLFASTCGNYEKESPAYRLMKFTFIELKEKANLAANKDPYGR